MAYNKNNSNDFPGLGCLVTILLAIIAMPIVGLYLVFAGKGNDTKLIGMVMLVIGVILWISMSGS